MRNGGRFGIVHTAVILLALGLGLAQKTSAEEETMGYQKLPTGTVRIWDTNEKYLHFYVGFVAWEDREQWTQVPYGKTDYEFKGEAVMENETMFLFLHSGKQSGPILYAKLGKKNPDAKRQGHEHSIHNALYRVWWEDGGEDHHYDSQPREGTRENRIEKNEQGEAVIVNIAGRDRMNAGRYRLLAEKHWLEVSPVEGKRADEMGYHGEARVMLVPDYKDGNDWSIQPDRERIDYVFDAAEDRWQTYGQCGSPDEPVHPTRRVDTVRAAEDKPEWGSYPMTPPGSKMLIDLQMSGGQFMWTMAYRSWKVAKPYLNWAPTGRLDRWPPWQEGPLKRNWENWVWSACYGCFGGEKIVVGVVNSPGSWHPEVVGTPLKDGKVDGKPVEAGDKYPCTWRPPYAGAWRMTARMGTGAYYSQQVVMDKGDEFVFACPVAGKLEYIILYLYDRTAETPPEVGTPMDIYREAIAGE
jgi:hypothetical protein